MNRIRRITAAALSVLLIGSVTTSALAEAAPTEKEEVIYIMTDASGKVTDMEVVNIFHGGEIVDYGDYSAVKPLNTTDTITQSGDKITFSSNAEKVYYQGTMKNTAIPWNISIRYFLDGKEYSAADIAGKSGALEIHFTISKNNACKGNYYDNYALQAAFTLDTDRCNNIKADGATVANVGSDMQLSYTILPGKGIDAVISADVTDFEMEAVTINGVRLNLNIEIDDVKLMDKVDELVSAIGNIDSGASEVNSGTKTLSSATGTLNDKVSDLYSGVGSLTSGAGELYSGLSNITAKNDQLTDAAYSAYEGLCTAAAAALNCQLKEQGVDPITLTPSTYSTVLLDLLAKMDADAVYQQAYQTALQQVTQQVEAQSDELYTGYIQSQANNIYQAYIASLADSLYAQVAAQSVYEQLIQSEYSAEQADAFLQSAEGQTAVTQAVDNMTEEQRTQILNTAEAGLADEQKEQILQGALLSLIDDEKAQIRESYIQQMMASDEVTLQLNAAVAAVSSAAEQVSELKGKLDSYGAFYQGLLDYTGAVSSAAVGAQMLKLNMDNLYDNTGTLCVSVGDLNDAVQTLYGGTQDLADGADEFVGKTSDMDTQIGDEIDIMTSAITGNDMETVSFVSEKNTSVKSVQYVIKTAAIEKAEVVADTVAEEPPLTFWHKLLRLFGLY